MWQLDNDIYSLDLHPQPFALTLGYCVKFSSSYLPRPVTMDLTPTFNDLLQKRDAPPARGKFSFDELEDFLKEAYRIVRLSLLLAPNSYLHAHLQCRTRTSPTSTTS